MTLMGWATHVLQWRPQREAMMRIGANPEKSRLSSDCSLQLESMKVESLVIVDQHATVNLYLGLVLPARHAPEAEWIGSLGGANGLLPFYLRYLRKQGNHCVGRAMTKNCLATRAKS